VIALLGGLTRRNLIELRRYGFDTFFQLAGVFMLFTLIFWGAKGIGGADIREGDTLPAIVAGYVVLWLVLGAYFTMSQWMTQEATLGTLEQLALSPFGLLNVLLAEFVASLGYQLLMLVVVLFASEAVTGQWLHIDVLTLLPLVLLLLVQTAGLSLVIGGAAVVFKRVASLANLLQFVFLAMVALPIDEDPWLRVMPIALGSHLVRQSTVEGRSLLDLDRGDLLEFVVVAGAYLAIGCTVFLRMERIARDRGVLGVH
jgi:ABC-2 type transport system permease protein